MSQRNIDFGAFPDDPNADAIRSAFEKVQLNFTEVFAGLGDQAVISVNKTAGSGIQVNQPTGNVVISANIANWTVRSSTLNLGISNPGTLSVAKIENTSQSLYIDLPSTATYAAGDFGYILANISSGNGNIDGNNITLTNNVVASNVYANAGIIGATTLTGTLSTAAQTNITSVGTLSDLTVTNPIVGSVTGSAATAGTVTTAAQPNITSTGTLTSLTVNGALGVTGSGVITGDGGGISNIAVGNLVGTVNLATFAGTANAVAGANVSGTVALATLAADATSANAVAGANVSGTVTTATNAVQVGITDDTSTAATHYVNFTAASSGNEAVKTSSSKLFFNPSTGDLDVTGRVNSFYFKTTPSTLATLPAAATAGTGARAMINDADAGSVFGAVAVGAGSLTLPVFSDATDWRIG